MVLTEGNTPRARLVAVAQGSALRVPGLHPGSMKVSDDFDGPRCQMSLGVKLLLDTHAFIWWDSDPAKLQREPERFALTRPTSSFSVLPACGRSRSSGSWVDLDLRLSLAEIVAHQQETNDVAILPIIQAHILALEDLPTHHRDPFDRLLVAQALVEGATLVSADPVLKAYPAEVRW